MHPSPSAETSKLLFPSLRFFICFSSFLQSRTSYDAALARCFSHQRADGTPVKCEKRERIQATSIKCTEPNRGRKLQVESAAGSKNGRPNFPLLALLSLRHFDEV